MVSFHMITTMYMVGAVSAGAVAYYLWPKEKENKE